METATSKKTIIKKILFATLGLGVAVFLAWYINKYVYNFFAGNSSTVNIGVNGPDTIDVSESSEPIPFKVTFNIGSVDPAELVTGFDLVLKYETEYIDYVSIEEPEWADLITDEEMPSDSTLEKSRRIVLVATDEITYQDTDLKQILLVVNFTTRSGEAISTIEEAEQIIALEYANAEIVGVDNAGQATDFAPQGDQTVKIVKLVRSTSTNTPTPEVTPGEGDAFLGFSPESSEILAHELITVQLTVNTGGKEIAGTDMYIKYDPEVIQFQSITQGEFMESIQTVENPGMLYVSGLTLTQGKGKTGEGVVATAVFKGIAVSQTSLEYICGEGDQSSRIQLVDIDATNIINCTVIKDHPIKIVAATPTPGIEEPTLSPTPQQITIAPNTPTPTKTVSGNDDVKLNMKVRFQGVTRQPSASQDTMDVKVTLSGRNGFSKEQTVTFKADGSGLWSGSMPVSNVTLNTDFAVLIKGPKHLAKKICVTNPRESVGGTYNCNEPNMTLKKGDNDLDFSNIILLAGDLPQQNQVVDSVDIVFIRQNFSNQSPDALKRGDLNLDGIIDTQDYALVLAALSFKYDEEL